MTRFYIIFIFLALAEFSPAQNNARLYSANGEVFKILIENKELNKVAQANVLVENIIKDTLVVKIKFENYPESETVIYLLDKGKKTTNKEYNYKITPGKESVKIVFTGIYETVHLPDPLVPEKPVK